MPKRMLMAGTAKTAHRIVKPSSVKNLKNYSFGLFFANMPPIRQISLGANWDAIFQH
jgi:hypothetical protein